MWNALLRRLTAAHLKGAFLILVALFFAVLVVSAFAKLRFTLWPLSIEPAEVGQLPALREELASTKTELKTANDRLGAIAATHVALARLPARLVQSQDGDPARVASEIRRIYEAHVITEESAEACFKKLKAHYGSGFFISFTGALPEGVSSSLLRLLTAFDSYQGDIEDSFATAGHALRLYQTQKGLKADGLLGRRTWEALCADYENLTASVKTAPALAR